MRQGTGGSLVQWAHTFSYHASGAVAGYTAANGATTTMSYDDRHRPNVLTSGPVWLDYTHDAAGNVTAIDDDRSGFDQGFGYDTLDRLTAVTGFAAATYAYDVRGNRTSKGSTSYSYNSNERLTSDGAQSYTYDSFGNTLTAGAQTYTYTPFHQVATALVSSATTTYGYDGDNQRRLRVRPDGVKEYFISGPGLVPLAEYGKAPGGSRVLVREYIYAGDRLVASEALEPTVAFTDDPIVAGSTAPKKEHVNEVRAEANQVRQRYGLAPVNFGTAIATGDAVTAAPLLAIRGALDDIATHTWPSEGASQPLATGEPIRAAHINELRDRIRALQAAASVRFFYHLDALGTVRAVTNTAGGTVRRHDYAPFGEELTPAPGADARRFTGKERDAETGLDYFSARYYRAATGRFTGVDPVRVSDQRRFDPQQWNLYSYARNNPWRFVDPTGMDVQVMDSEALERIRSTLAEGIRSQVVLNKNGFIVRAALNAIKSTDKNFLALRELVNMKGVVQVATAGSIDLGGKKEQFMYESVASIAQALAKAGVTVDPGQLVPTSFLGYTETGGERTHVTISNRRGAAAGAPVGELAVTTAHELYGHALLRMQGAPYLHGDPGVDAAIRAIEMRTRRMYERR